MIGASGLIFTRFTFRVPEAEEQLVFEGEDIQVTGSPVKHLLPTLALRFHFLKSAKSAAISSDTEPSSAMVRLAAKCRCSDPRGYRCNLGHSSAEQAGEVAQQAQAKTLWLIHYTPGNETANLVQRASKTFSGDLSPGQRLDQN
jgi:ribonuclease Z